MASVTADAGDFDVSLGCLLRPAVGGLAAQLDTVAGLTDRERGVILAAVDESLHAVLHARLARLLVLELHEARKAGRLHADTSEGRWHEFLAMSSTDGFWDDLRHHYPTLASRVGRLVEQRCDAALAFARHWAADRPTLHPLLDGGDPGELWQLSFGAGDSHRGGRTVALLHCEGGRLVYKPRPMAVDAALAGFLAQLRPVHTDAIEMRLPHSLGFAEHGWSAHVTHRHAENDDELHAFYRGIGQWLAVMRLLGGTDLHAENLIAHGAHPYVIDCETLFTPRRTPRPSGFGAAVDRAGHTVDGTVLSIGMLPGRGMGLGWRGVDMSALGALPGQQPTLAQLDLIEAGTDRVRIGTRMVAVEAAAQNHPCPEPVLSRFWPDVLAGFDSLTETLQALDAAGALRPILGSFEPCRIRVVTRATEVYAELGRMLWHPVSLHDEVAARERARALLERMAGNVASAPGSPTVIAAEIDELLEGDIPLFETTPAYGRLDGPRGTRWGKVGNLVDEALLHWRHADFTLERNIIRAALVSAYINEGWVPDETSLWPERSRPGDLDTRRRRIAADILRGIVGSAILGEDGSIAWIAPVFDPTFGWAVRPLGHDVYGGIAGIALLVAGYRREMRAGRADAVDGLDGVLAATLRTMDLAEAKWAAQRADAIRIRPPQAGGYFGIGSLIWVRLRLHAWGIDPEGVSHAMALADTLPDAVAADDMPDVLSGTAGAIPALLMLHRASGEARYLSMAKDFAQVLGERAAREGGRAWWPHAQWPDGIGGFAHGSTGIGWALRQLNRVAPDAERERLEREAFGFDDALYDTELAGWKDLRLLPGAPTAAAWCHGAVGIALCRIDEEGDEAKRRLRRAAQATRQLGLGWNHSVCHGDASSWELLDRAIRQGEGPEDLTRESLLAQWLTSMEDHGPVCGIVRDAFAPGLMSGLGGIAWQLLRAGDGHELPSILTMEDEV